MARAKTVREAKPIGFDAVVAAFEGQDGIEVPEPSRRSFASNALKVNGRIFAMFVRGALVVKLPAARVAELIAAGDATPFDAGKGRPMKEWAVVTAPSRRWLSLAREAHRFVEG